MAYRVKIMPRAQRDILRIVLRHSLVPAAGVALGVTLAYMAGRAMQALLAGVAPGDAATLLSAAALCALMALAGSLAPAIRALALDPIAAIRAE